jgi:hypothetical protein
MVFPLLLDKIINRWNTKKYMNDMYKLQSMVKLCPMFEIYIQVMSDNLDINNHYTFCEMHDRDKNSVNILKDHFITSEKKKYGDEIVQCNYCKNKYCSFHVIYSEFCHYKCKTCKLNVSVCKECSENIKKKECIECKEYYETQFTDVSI